ncbi:ring finger domain-containing protein [Rutstroemia sp. NJR-2017a BBW]|nr:ring finger domain-containing protein [Rutstroemia sp. NJR-2017a BBW]
MDLWLGAVLYVGKTSTCLIIYDTALTCPVTAGVGPFNGSLVQTFKTFFHTLRLGYVYETIPYNYLASAYTLVLNPLVATVAQPMRCVVEPCISYLLSGGLTMVVPWVPREHSEYPLVKVKHAPSIQADFAGPIMDNLAFTTSDCDIFGQYDVLIGIRLCLKTSPSEPGVLMAVTDIKNRNLRMSKRHCTLSMLSRQAITKHNHPSIVL